MEHHCEKWSKEEDALLRRVYGRKLVGEIASLLGRSQESVRRRAFLLGLRSSCMVVADRDVLYMEKVRRELYG